MMFNMSTIFFNPLPMLLFIRKYAAVSIAIWLPLFSGNALAASVMMQMENGDCHPVAAQPGTRLA